MPQPHCLTCGKALDLELATYRNFRGPVPCPDCRAHTHVIFSDGELQGSLGGLRWEGLMLDLATYDIPVPIIGDLAEAAAVFSINAHKSSVVMCGRAVHGALKEKKVPGRYIGAMLKTARCRGLISEDLYQTTLAANYFRITGAHAKRLRNVDETQALLTFQVTKDVLKHLFGQSQTPAWQVDIGSNEPSPSPTRAP